MDVRVGALLMVTLALLGSACQGLGLGGARPPPADVEPPTAAAHPVRRVEPLIEETPPYELVETHPTGSVERVRYETDILVPSSYGREELIAVLADAARKTLLEQEDVQAVVVFAFTEREYVGRLYDTGRALLSRDGRGWRGDNSLAPFLPISDTGKIYVTLGSALTGLEHIEVER